MAKTTIPSELIADNAVGITQLNVSDGSNGQFLKTDGSGTLSFGTVSTTTALDDIATGDAASTLATSSGSITLDSPADIILDADTDGRVFFFDGGTEYGNVGKSSNSLYLKSAISDGDILFQGNDGGSSVTALTLDMSDAGSAYFNNKVGIGTTSPGTFFHIKTTSPTISMTDTNSFADTNDRFQLRANADVGQFQWYDDSASSTSTLMTIHPSGCVGVGSTADRSIDTNVGTLVVNGSAGGGLWLSTGDSSATTSKIYAANNGSVGELIINNGGGVGSGGIIIKTNDSEKMRILSGGSVLIGTTSLLQSDNKVSIAGSATGAGSGVIDIRNTSSNDNCGVISLSKATTTTSSASRYIYFYASNFGTNMGAIAANGTGNVGFVATSDQRLKENIQPITGSLDKVLALNPVSFDWKANGEHTKAGFVAQEVESVLPEYVATDEDTDKTKGLTGGMTGGYIAVLTKALQEANDKITALEARVKTLEG
tara:strand:+ start:553 stop:2007 length:1455 start_codon:yes stop_codon:yes gene_type:complete